MPKDAPASTAGTPYALGASGARTKARLQDRLPADHARDHSTGRIAIETEFCLIPLTCSTNGRAEISYFIVLRMPSQSVAPLNAFGFRECPSCTMSTQPPADRLTVYVPAFGGALKLAKPAKVPSFGARSGGKGSLASVGALKASVIPLDGRAASSPPETSLTRSGAVSAERSRSMFHLNLSQPLGSSAARAGTAASSANAIRRGARMMVPTLPSRPRSCRAPAGCLIETRRGDHRPCGAARLRRNGIEY